MESLGRSGHLLPDNKLAAMKRAIGLLKFQQRKCKTFIPREVNNGYCVCNQQKSAHPDAIIKENEEWNWEKHTAPEITECYGMLSQSNSTYLRCSVDTNLDQTALVLFSIWGVPIPSLIMHIISDSSSKLDAKLEKEVLIGISDAAMASDALIITNCYKQDPISQLIGEVIYKSQVKNPEINFRAVGVGKWGGIDHPITQGARTGDGKIDLHERSHRNTLELNLSNYIFFDDGTYHSMDDGTFAEGLAREVSTGARRKIELVNILVGADLQSLKHIYDDLGSGIPLVVVDQSGPLSNLIYKYFKLTENSMKKVDDQHGKFSDDDGQAENADENSIDETIFSQKFGKKT